MTMEQAAYGLDYSTEERERFVTLPTSFAEQIGTHDWRPLERLLVEPLRLIVCEYDWQITIAAGAQGEVLTPETVADCIRRSPRLTATLRVEGNRITCPRTKSEIIIGAAPA